MPTKLCFLSCQSWKRGSNRGRQGGSRGRLSGEGLTNALNTFNASGKKIMSLHEVALLFAIPIFSTKKESNYLVVYTIDNQSCISCILWTPGKTSQKTPSWIVPGGSSEQKRICICIAYSSVFLYFVFCGRQETRSSWIAACGSSERKR